MAIPDFLTKQEPTMSTEPQTSAGSDNFPCIKCGEGQMQITRREQVDSGTERQLLFCNKNECDQEITRLVNSDGKSTVAGPLVTPSGLSD